MVLSKENHSVASMSFSRKQSPSTSWLQCARVVVRMPPSLDDSPPRRRQLPSAVPTWYVPSYTQQPLSQISFPSRRIRGSCCFVCVYISPSSSPLLISHYIVVFCQYIPVCRQCFSAPIERQKKAPSSPDTVITLQLPKSKGETDTNVLSISLPAKSSKTRSVNMITPDYVPKTLVLTE